ncbi:MAG: tRNA glutamyl-Q(34) synthetase GluQRS [Duodenibacillus sp.]|nr:tRNA glutamyl-Q(34) synthetase GluQRS [Duodenibacillus sp.]
MNTGSAGAAAPYTGRFAPSPTGPLHLGSLACAMASHLDARAHGGAWIVRIEDVDGPRCVPGADRDILATLAAFGMESDAPVVRQSERGELYEAVFRDLVARGLAYACACSRQEIVARAAELGLPAGVYPGTCRDGTCGRPGRAWRFRTDARPVAFADRLAGPVESRVERDAGDFVIRRADGPWAYQLAVVVDDALQGVTHVVRGMDLLDNTARQIALQRALGYPQPSYMHIPLVVGAGGEKLSKQRKAPRVTAEAPAAALDALMPHFGLRPTGAASPAAFWRAAAEQWRERFAL